MSRVFIVLGLVCYQFAILLHVIAVPDWSEPTRIMAFIAAGLGFQAVAKLAP